MARLLLDIDTRAMPRHFDRRLFRFVELWGLRVKYWHLKRSRRGWHVVVVVADKLDPATIVAMQALLGSDMAREAYNLARVRTLGTMSDFWRSRWQTLYGPSCYPFRPHKRGRRNRTNVTV